jgi:hypothetical protein
VATKVINIMSPVSAPLEHHTGIFNEFLAARRLTVDYRSRLFWGTDFASATETTHFINTPHPIDPLIPHHLYPPLLYQAQTGQIPVTVHFSDHLGKGLMDDWWGKFWWNMLQGRDQTFKDIVLTRLEAATVTIAGEGPMSWSDMCDWTSLANVSSSRM